MCQAKDFEPCSEDNRESLKAVEQRSHLMGSASVAAWLLGLISEPFPFCHYALSSGDLTLSHGFKYIPKLLIPIFISSVRVSLLHSQHIIQLATWHLSLDISQASQS